MQARAPPLLSPLCVIQLYFDKTPALVPKISGSGLEEFWNGAHDADPRWLALPGLRDRPAASAAPKAVACVTVAAVKPHKRLLAF